MTKRVTLIITIGAVFILAAGVFFCFTYNALDGLDTSVHKESKVVFDNLNDTVYVMASSWGLTGDHVEIVLSSSPVANRASNALSDYIFYEPTVYYKKEKDTLIVYSPSIAVIPDNFNANVRIRQVQVHSNGEMKKYEQIYKEQGLIRVSVYK
jgi:hypothetical protein